MRNSHKPPMVSQQSPGLVAFLVIHNVGYSDTGSLWEWGSHVLKPEKCQSCCNSPPVDRKFHGEFHSKIIKILWLLKTCFVSSCACAMICHDDLPWVQAANQCAASCSVFRCAPPGRTETGHRADHVTMAQGHHLLEGAIANASPDASQAWHGVTTPPQNTVESYTEMKPTIHQGLAACELIYLYNIDMGNHNFNR